MLKQILTITALLTLLSSACAWAIELDEYNVVDTRRQLSDIQFDFDFKSGNQPQSSYNGILSGNYEMMYSTLPLAWTLDVDGKIGFQKDSQEDAEAEEEYNVTVETTGDKYFSNVNMGSFLNMNEFLGFGSLKVGYRKSKNADDADDPYVKIGAGVGLGRVIDATDLAKAMRLIDDLMKHGIVSRAPSKEGYFEMAQIISRQSEYKKTYSSETYERYWFEELEKVLQREGILTTNALGSLGNLRAQEVLVNIPLNSGREHGRLARFGLGYIASDYAGEDTDPTLDLSYEYALPRSTYKFQLINTSGYSLKFGDTVHSLSNTLKLLSALSLRTDWENEWTITYWIPEGDNTLTNNLRSTLRYYITSKVDITGTLNFTHIADGIDDNENDDLTTAFRLGIGYTFR